MAHEKPSIGSSPSETPTAIGTSVLTRVVILALVGVAVVGLVALAVMRLTAS
jgi:hypothetical protein